RLRIACRAMQRIDWQMGVLLRTFFDLRLHRAFGFPSASRYVAERLGLSGRKARALVALERGLRRTPALAAAYREGNVPWLRALEGLREAPRARLPRVGGPAAAPRPGLRARRLALRGPGLHFARQPPRPPHPVSLGRWRQLARQPRGHLRLAPPARHPPGPHP